MNDKNDIEKHLLLKSNEIRFKLRYVVGHVKEEVTILFAHVSCLLPDNFSMLHCSDDK